MCDSRLGSASQLQFIETFMSRAYACCAMSMDDKHTFLKHAKHLKEVNLRYDDDLTTLQQKQRQDMSADFDTLKS